MVYCVTGIYIQYLVVTYNGKESEKSIYIIYVCVCVLVVQSGLTLCDPMDCSPQGASDHGILQARKLEWVAISFSNYICICNMYTYICVTDLHHHIPNIVNQLYFH